MTTATNIMIIMPRRTPTGTITIITNSRVRYLTSG
jgi:hypothetical protein